MNTLDDISGRLLDAFERRRRSEQAAYTPRPTILPVDVSISLEGELSDTQLPVLLHSLHIGRKTGKLHLEKDDVAKTVYWLKGYPVWVESALEGETLGKYLTDNDIITDEVYAQSVDIMQSSKKKHGEVLLEMGAITPHQLFEALTLSLKFKLLNCFSWMDGKFSFMDMEEIPPELLMTRLEPGRLVIEGIGEHFEEIRDTIKSQITLGMKTVPSESHHYDPSQLHLGPEEQRIYLRALDGDSVSQILSITESGDRALMLLYAMKCMDIISFSEAQEGTHTPASDHDEEHGRAHGTDSEKIRELREEFLEEYKRLKDADHFELFGVSHDAHPTRIYEGYMKIRKRYHQDGHFRLLFHRSDKLAKLGRKLDMKIEEAYETLINEGDRKEYIRTSRIPDRITRPPAGSRGSRKSVPPATEPAQKTQEEKEQQKAESEAEDSFQLARRYLNSRDYVLASKAFAQALERCPQNPRYNAYMGWSLFLLDQDRNIRQANDHIKRALEINPKSNYAKGFRTVIKKLKGKLADRIEGYRMLIKLDPDSRYAAGELRRLLEYSRRKGSK